MTTHNKINIREAHGDSRLKNAIHRLIHAGHTVSLSDDKVRYVVDEEYMSASDIVKRASSIISGISKKTAKKSVKHGEHHRARTIENNKLSTLKGKVDYDTALEDQYDVPTGHVDDIRSY